MLQQLIHARGHPEVRSTHPTTIEITTEGFLTTKGDCIIAVSAGCGCAGLHENMKEALKAGKRIQITISCGGETDIITGRGHKDLTFTNPVSIVIRKSEFVCPRTLCISANKAAKDLKRDLVDKLKSGKDVTVKLEIFD